MVLAIVRQIERLGVMETTLKPHDGPDFVAIACLHVDGVLMSGRDSSNRCRLQRPPGNTLWLGDAGNWEFRAGWHSRSMFSA